ncbi:MAG: hypothetical protein HQK55_08005 [Deltaproteobacteria bacterium]|nr:hypothetical protein [Deltaproteobacteria bacterium]
MSNEKQKETLVDLKLSKAETKAENSGLPSRSKEKDQYPWGLSLTLNKTVMDKLGLSLEKLAAGGKVKFEAEASIDRINASAGKGKDADYSCSLEIQKMSVKEIIPPEPKKKDEGKSVKLLGSWK